jgi:hypothetical protein
MFNSGQGNFQSETFENAPNMSLAFTMWSTTFGNGNFIITPPSLGEVGQGFPTVPYLSLEALIYQQQASNPAVASFNVTAGSSAGQQVVGSTTSQNDANGTPRVLNGSQATG